MADQEALNIDPSVEKHLEDAVNRSTEGAIPSPFFGDSIIIEQPETVLLPGETPVEAHIRLQKEQ